MLAIQSGFSQVNFDKVKLDNYFSSLEENNEFMGSVSVSKNGVILYSKIVGFSDIEKKIKADKNSTYRIGSISKTFTSVLVLKAVEEGKLDLNQKISKWFPRIKSAKQITVKQLLSHRSGIHDFTNDRAYSTWYTKAKTEKEMIKIIEQGGSDFEPDSKAVYSNSNFVLLTYILEKIYRKKYSHLLQEYITQPAGLKNTYVFEKTGAEKNECRSYTFSGSWKLQAETHYSIPLGAGAVISTSEDLILFAEALFGGKLLKPESLELMKTIQDGFGIGLLKFPFYQSTGYGHSGSIDGFTSFFVHFPEDGISFALVSNAVNYNINNISLAVLSAVKDIP